MTKDRDLDARANREKRSPADCLSAGSGCDYWMNGRLSHHTVVVPRLISPEDLCLYKIVTSAKRRQKKSELSTGGFIPSGMSAVSWSCG